MTLKNVLGMSALMFAFAGSIACDGGEEEETATDSGAEEETEDSGTAE